MSTSNLSPWIKVLSLAAGSLAAASALAVPITPTYTTFGQAPGFVTFGGTGIPTNLVANTVIQDGAKTITIGLAAFQRYANPVVSGSNGVYTATPGVNDGLDAPPHALGATWGLGWYINVSGGGLITDYDYKLNYDLDSAAGTDAANHGSLTKAAILFPGLATVTPTSSQSAQNMYSSFWATTTPGYINAPAAAYSNFGSNNMGEYTFSLQVKSIGGTDLGQVAMQVNVVPEPEAYAMAIVALAGLGLVARRRGKQA